MKPLTSACAVYADIFRDAWGPSPLEMLLVEREITRRALPQPLAFPLGPRSMIGFLDAEVRAIRWARLGLSPQRPTGAPDDEFPFYMGPDRSAH